MDGKSGALAAGQSNRRIYIDFIKIIAIFMVLFNHTGRDGFMFFTVVRDSRLYPFYMFFSILIKIAVPLFFMASGALLLEKEETYGHLMRKRFLRYFLVLVIGSALAYLYAYLRFDSQDLSVGHFLRTLYSSNATVAYWYLYTYLAYILSLPLLRKIAKAMTDRDYQWMFFLYGAFRCLAIFEFLIWKGEVTHNEEFYLFSTVNYFFFPLMGYYIDRRLRDDKFHAKNLILLSIASVIAIAICCGMTHYKGVLTGEWAEGSCQTFFKTLIFLPTITAFYGAKLWFMRHKVGKTAERVIVAAGGTTFGIFLIEQICRKETRPIFALLEPKIHTMPACLIWIFCACLGGGVVIYLLKKIPGLGKYI